MGQQLNISEFLKKLSADGRDLEKIRVDRTPKGHRRFDLSQFFHVSPKRFNSEKHTIGYARVSSHDQKDDLLRQAQVLENFCAANGWTHEIVQDLGSGLNFQKRGLKKCQRKIEMSPFPVTEKR